MRASRGSCLLVLLLVGVLTLDGVAFAHTISHPTSLSISRRPGRAVERGTRVTFSGKLSSAERACRNGSQVKLIRVGRGIVAMRTTNERGKYSFRVRVRRTAKWRVRFGGKVLNATHPHNHTCRRSATRRFRVRVG